MENVEHTATAVDIEQTHAEVAEHGATGDESLAASLGLNTQLFVFQLINFAIVGAILWFLILKPLSSKLEERKKMIDDSVNNAKEIETNLAMSQQKYDEKLKEAKAEANKVIEKAHTESKKLGDDMRDKAKTDVEAIVAQAKKTIQSEKQEMMEDVKKESALLIMAALEKVLNTKVDEKVDKKLIEDSLEKFNK